MTEPEIQQEIEETSPYCPTCGSCGETGCCYPDRCKVVQCYYGESNLIDYKELLNSNEQLRRLLKEVYDWVDNWKPAFRFDPDWKVTEQKITEQTKYLK